MAPFRRPASLSPVRAEQIPGDPDPGDATALAHDSAAALVAQVRGTVDSEVVQRVVNLAQTEGVDDIAELWSRAPGASLPGALWRLYALHAWTHDDPSEVAGLYEAGVASAPGLRMLSGVQEPPGIDEIRRTADEILRGVFTGDFSVALSRAAAVYKLVAFGAARSADALPEAAEVEASTLTGRAASLLRSGEELDEAAHLAAAGTLT